MGRPENSVSAAISGGNDQAGGIEPARAHDGVVTQAPILETDIPDSLGIRDAPDSDLSPETDLRRPAPQADVASVTGPEAGPATADAPSVSDPSGFATWSRRYTARLMALDGLMGMLAVVGAAVIFPNISFSTPKLAVLIFGAGLAWPVAVAISRGYERTKIGVGGDEMRAVLRAVTLAIAAGAVPSAVTGKYGVVALCVMATPIAGMLSLAVRFIARKHLHYQQRNGHNVRRVIVVGSAYSAADLHTVLTREPQCGMQVIGVCVPQSDIQRAHDAGMMVIGDLEQVPALIKTHRADAVAVTTGDATRHNYLRELSWALEGAGVELLVHPGLVEVAGPRMHIRPYEGLPLLHVEQPHFTGWRRFIKRATDITLDQLRPDRDLAAAGHHRPRRQAE